MTNYPAQIDTTASLPTAVDLQSPVVGATVNQLRDAIIVIEAELGVQPAGADATVSARLSRIENLITLDVVTINGDLGGTPSSPLVIGLQGRPISSAQPAAGQALIWNGIVWAPANSISLAQDLGGTPAAPLVIGLQGIPISTTTPTNGQVLTYLTSMGQWIPQSQSLNVLPANTLLPVEVLFLGGDGYSTLTSPTRVGARNVDMSPFPLTTADGRTRTLKFIVDLEVTNPAATGVALLKNLTDNAYINGASVSNATNASPIVITTTTNNNFSTGQVVFISGVQGNTAANGTWTITVTSATTFSLNGSTGNAPYTSGGIVAAQYTSSTSSVELSLNIPSGNIPGTMRTDSIDNYEVDIFIINGGVSDNVICNNARIYVTYSPPVVISQLIPVVMPIDINFVAGTELNGFSTPAGVGGRVLDLSQNLIPAQLADGRNRFIEFYVDAEVSTIGVDGYVQLWDTTDNALVTGTFFHITNTTGQEVNSVNLTTGVVPGTIRVDRATRYECQIWKVSGSPADRIICNNARLTITYM
jgi:hypothetical protein